MLVLVLPLLVLLAQAPRAAAVGEGEQGRRDLQVQQLNGTVIATTETARRANGNPGRLEVQHLASQLWGTVCDDNFSDVEASVACRQMGYRTGSVSSNAGFRVVADSVPIMMDEVNCAGTETSLWDCSYTSTHNCRHEEDVYVDCQDPVNTLSRHMRLVHGTRGRLEVSRDGHTWGTVCSDDFDSADADIACRGLGFKSGVALSSNPGYAVVDSSVPILMSNVTCPSGLEFSLWECSYTSLHNCTHAHDVYVECEEYEARERRAVRVVGGSRGRLEVTLNGYIWGTVCNDAFQDEDAAVACRQLGFDGGGRVWYNEGGDPVLSYLVPILMDEVGCDGSEASLWDCAYRSDHDCGHIEDVYVDCVSPNLAPTVAPSSRQGSSMPAGGQAVVALGAAGVALFALYTAWAKSAQQPAAAVGSNTDAADDIPTASVVSNEDLGNAVPFATVPSAAENRYSF